MTFDYSEIAADAHLLIQEFGAPATLTLYGEGTYSGGTVTPSETTVACTACVFAYPQRLVDGAVIQQGDQQVYLSAFGLTVPKAGDRFTWSGVAYSIVSVKPLAPAGELVLCELQVRA